VTGLFHRCCALGASYAGEVSEELKHQMIAIAAAYKPSMKTVRRRRSAAARIGPPESRAGLPEKVHLLQRLVAERTIAPKDSDEGAPSSRRWRTLSIASMCPSEMTSVFMIRARSRQHGIDLAGVVPS